MLSALLLPMLINLSFASNFAVWAVTQRCARFLSHPVSLPWHTPVLVGTSPAICAWGISRWCGPEQPLKMLKYALRGVFFLSHSLCLDCCLICSLGCAEGQRLLPGCWWRGDGSSAIGAAGKSWVALCICRALGKSWSLQTNP